MEKLIALGTGSALPIKNRGASSQVIQSGNSYYLIDCGEGTQLKLRDLKIPFLRINHIFISHLHGDHFLGLPGLISSFNLLNRHFENLSTVSSNQRAKSSLNQKGLISASITPSIIIGIKGVVITQKHILNLRLIFLDILFQLLKNSSH